MQFNKFGINRSGVTEDALRQPAVFNQPVTVAYQLIECSEEAGFNLIIGDVGRLAAVAGLAEPFILIIATPDLFTVSLIALVAAPDLLAERSSAIGANKP